MGKDKKKNKENIEFVDPNDYYEDRPSSDDDEQQWSIWYDSLVEEDPSVED